MTFHLPADTIILMSIFDYVALVFIAGGWAIQLNTKKSSGLNPSFLVLYVIGSLMLAFNALDNRYIAGSLLNLTSVAIAAAILFRQQK